MIDHGRAEGQEPEEPTVKEKASRMKRLVLLLLLLFIVAGVGWVSTQLIRGRSLAETLVSAVTTSEDVALSVKARTSLALSKRIAGLEVDVAARRGIVTLTGDVPSQEIKDLAEEIVADTEGVHGVNNQLSIDPAVRPDPEVERLRKKIVDLETRAAVRDALLGNPELTSSAAGVRVSGGHVTLTGDVETPDHRYGAERVARGIEGVSSVQNELTVAGSGPKAKHERLSRLVEFELYSIDAFDLDRIRIEARGSEILLSGQVRSRSERLLAEMTATSVEGVDRVVNDLRVAGPAPGAGEGAVPEEAGTDTAPKEPATSPALNEQTGAEAPSEPL
jgi:hyperosmotically inducible protein